MTKIVSNKKYEEFWNNDTFDIKSEQKSDTKLITNKDNIKKEVKKITNKIQTTESIETDLPKRKRIIKPKGEKLKKNIEEINNNIEICEIPVETPIQPIEVPIDIKPIHETLIQPVEQLVLNKDFYDKYILDEQPYKIFFRGNLIYDSINHDQIPMFLDDGFILFGKKYIYRGIRFEKY